jgi:hypothetical protein
MAQNFVAAQLATVGESSKGALTMKTGSTCMVIPPSQQTCQDARSMILVHRHHVSSPDWNSRDMWVIRA